MKKIVKGSLKSLLTLSPLSIHLFSAHLKRNTNVSLKQVFDNDFELLKILLKEEEFYEGIRFLLIDKGKTDTNWVYKSLDQVPQTVVEHFMDYQDSGLKLDNI